MCWAAGLYNGPMSSGPITRSRIFDGLTELERERWIARSARASRGRLIGRAASIRCIELLLYGTSKYRLYRSTLPELVSLITQLEGVVR